MPALVFGAAALFEIAGCYLVWQALRLGQPLLWAPALMALALFAYLLTLTGADSAGRTFAVYGGIYIVASLVFMVLGERVRPDLWDLAGGMLCLIGAAVIFFGPRVG
jgi:small multidrug resistance family-3 protein